MRWLLVPLLVVCGAGAILGSLRNTEAPRPVVNASSESSQPQRCAECHEEIVASFASAPHNLTLRPGTDPEVARRLVGRTATLRGESFRFERAGDQLRFSAERVANSATVDWVFGSGNHALTPVTLTKAPDGKTAMLETMASWYAAGDLLDLTPGTEDAGAQMGALGRYHGYADTVGCFECHSTYLPADDGRIDVARIHPGVSCVRCHQGGAQHVASDGDVPTLVPWNTLPAGEAINRCGECHRRSDEFTPDELVPENKLLIRFAPVSISQSRCFQAPTPPTPDGRPRRMDCLTCHDPHLVTEQSPQFYVNKCLACHDSQTSTVPDCAAQPMTSQCLECHMPTVPITERLFFTDHWIRIRDTNPTRQRGNALRPR